MQTNISPIAKISSEPPGSSKTGVPFFGEAKSAPSLFIQPKLSVNQPGDPFEQEADAMADTVMRMPAAAPTPISGASFFKPSSTSSIQKASGIQKKCAACEEEEQVVRREVDEEDAESGGILQRKCNHCEEDEHIVRRKDTDSGNTPQPSTAVEKTLSSSGQPLDAGTRTFMEQRFGQDFGHVQIHNDSLAHQSSSDIQAKAYTHQNHIAFGAGQYKPQSDAGKHLLAHELTHVVQQGGVQTNESTMISRNAGAPVGPAQSPIDCNQLLKENEEGTNFIKHLAKAITGRQVHKVVGEDFLENVPGAVKPFQIPGATAKPQRTDEDPYIIDPQIISILSSSRNPGTPDLALFENGVLEIAELKPAYATLVADGIDQLIRYIEQLTADDPADPMIKFRKKRKIIEVKRMPPSRYSTEVIPYGNLVIRLVWCDEGVLVYDVYESDKDDEKEKADDSAGTNKGIGISINSKVSGGSNAAVGIAITTNGTARYTVAGGIVYNSKGKAIASISGGASANAIQYGAGTATAGAVNNVKSAAALHADAGAANNSSTASAVGAAAGTSQGDVSVNLAVAGKGSSEHHKGINVAKAGSSGDNKILPDLPGIPDHAKENIILEAARLDAMLRHASKAQRDLIKTIASRQPDGVFPIDKIAWLEKMLAVTSGLKEEDIKFLSGLPWEPGLVETDDLQKDINDALAHKEATRITSSAENEVKGNAANKHGDKAEKKHKHPDDEGSRFDFRKKILLDIAPQEFSTIKTSAFKLLKKDSLQQDESRQAIVQLEVVLKDGTSLFIQIEHLSLIFRKPIQEGRVNFYSFDFPSALVIHAIDGQLLGTYHSLKINEKFVYK